MRRPKNHNVIEYYIGGLKRVIWDPPAPMENGHSIWNFEFQGRPQASFIDNFARELVKYNLVS